VGRFLLFQFSKRSARTEHDPNLALWVMGWQDGLVLRRVRGALRKDVRWRHADRFLPLEFWAQGTPANQTEPEADSDSVLPVVWIW